MPWIGPSNLALLLLLPIHVSHIITSPIWSVTLGVAPTCTQALNLIISYTSHNVPSHLFILNSMYNVHSIYLVHWQLPASCKFLSYCQPIFISYETSLYHIYHIFLPYLHLPKSMIQWKRTRTVPCGIPLLLITATHANHYSLLSMTINFGTNFHLPLDCLISLSLEICQMLC